MNFFIHHFVLQERRHELLRQTDKLLIRRKNYGDCPSQLNGFDCGLFTIDPVLHLSEGEDVTTETFSEQHVTKLRSHLAAVFSMDGAWTAETTSQVVRSCFPQLCGSSLILLELRLWLQLVCSSVTKRWLRSDGILDSVGIEVVATACAVPKRKVPVTKHPLRSDGILDSFGVEVMTSASAVMMTNVPVTNANSGRTMTF